MCADQQRPGRGRAARSTWPLSTPTWTDTAGRAGATTTIAELESIHRLRERLGKIWETADDEVRAVGQVNALLSDTRASPWLTRHPEMPEWHLHLASIHDPLWQRMGAEMAMALADIIRDRGAAPAQGLRRTGL